MCIIIFFLSVTYDPRVIQLLDPPHFGSEVLNAGPAQFGYDLRNNAGVCVFSCFNSLPPGNETCL